MSECKLWRSESAQRLRAAMATGTDQSRAAFGEWYRWRVWRSIEARIILQAFAFEDESELRGALASLEARWIVRHERLCDEAGLDAEIRPVLAQSVLRRVFDSALQAMHLDPLSTADLGSLA